MSAHHYLTSQEIVSWLGLDTGRREEFDLGNPIADEDVSPNKVAMEILNFPNIFPSGVLDTEKESNSSIDCSEAPPRPSFINPEGDISTREIRLVLRRETKFAPIIIHGRLWTGMTEPEDMKSSQKLIRSQSSLSGSTDGSPNNKKE
jgi:hypothetical protein